MTRREALKKMGDLSKRYNKIELDIEGLEQERAEALAKIKVREEDLRARAVAVRKEIESCTKEILHPTDPAEQEKARGPEEKCPWCDFASNWPAAMGAHRKRMHNFVTATQ